MRHHFTPTFLSIYDKIPFSSYVNESICQLANSCPEIATAYKIGLSVQHTPILALSLGHGPVSILLHGTHHAREAITSILLLDQISYLIYLYERNACIKRYHIADVLEDLTFVFVPLVNPDGANLALSNKNYEDWKANIRGVDLNENYPTTYPSDFLTESPGPNGYPGLKPFSEPEAAALKQLTECYDFAGTISYHSSGEEIYWYYNQDDLKRDESIAKSVAKITGYELLHASAPAHGSGYKDWFIETYHRPALTIEVAPYVGDRPVPASNYESIWDKNKLVPLVFGCAVYNHLD